jgi:transposase
LFKEKGVVVHLCSIHYPQSDGLTERTIQTIKEKKRLDTEEEDLQQKLKLIAQGLNKIPRIPVEYTPKEIIETFKNRN